MNRRIVRQLTACAKAAVAVGLLSTLFVTSSRAGTLEDAKAKGELVVGTEFQFAPFEFLDGNTPVGFDVDLMTLIAKDLGLKLTWVDLPWASVLPALEAKRYDMVVAGTSRTKARLERYDMTIPIGDGTVALVKRRDDNTIMKPADIAGKDVGGIKGSAQLTTFENFIKTVPGGVKELHIYIGSTNAYADLLAKRVSAVVGAVPNLSYLAKMHPEYDVVLPPFGPPTYFSWTLRKEPASDTLLAAVNAEIKKFDQDGTVAKLQTKWFGRVFPLPTDALPDPSN